jgi:hypothetical protein
MPAIPEYERFPKPPGQNPYRIKGTAYRGHLAYVSEYVPGGVKAHNAAIVDPALAAFFEQPFLAASYYDLYPLIAAGHACARLTNTTFDGFIRVRTKFQAHRDVAGVYKVLLKLTSPEGLALRLPRLVGQYLDFGSADGHLVKPGHVVGSQSGTPRSMARWFALVHEAYIETLMPMAGAKNVRHRADPLLRTDETKDGVELVTLRSDVMWDE